MDVPPHPDTNDYGTPPPGKPQARSLGVTVALGALALLVVVVIVLHLTGVVGPLAR